MKACYSQKWNNHIATDRTSGSFSPLNEQVNKI